MKILITGGEGYIGQNLYWSAWSNDPLKFEFELCDKETVLSVLPEAQKLEKKHLEGFDGIIHLAALSGIQACEAFPEEAAVDNILTAGNVFRLANEMNIPVVFTSSQAAKNPHANIYANMKWTCERLADYYNNGNIYVVRLANVYGGSNYIDKKNTCVKQFITKYRNNEPFTIHGDGSQERDFIHVWDVCEAICRIIKIKPEYFSPIDIGTGKPTSILELANMFPNRMDDVFVESRSAGEKSSIADTSILKELIDFIPERKVNDYIKEMIKWIRI